MKAYATIFTILSLLSVAFCLLDLDESGELSVGPVQVIESAGIRVFRDQGTPNSNLLLTVFDNAPQIIFLVRGNGLSGYGNFTADI